MEDEADIEAALKKDKGHMGKRYIEVFESQVILLEVEIARERNVM